MFKSSSRSVRQSFSCVGLSLIALLTAGGLMTGGAMAQGLSQQPLPDTGAAALASNPPLTQNTPTPDVPQLGEGVWLPLMMLWFPAMI